MSFSPGRFPFHVVGTFLLLCATLVASKITANRKIDTLAQPLDSIPMTLVGLSGVADPPLSKGVLDELKATSYISRNYGNGPLSVNLFIAYYSKQRAGESMHSPKHCLPGAGWEIWNYDTMKIATGGREYTINNYSVSHSGERRKVLYWYQSRERVFASEYLGKLLLARDTLLHNATAASIVRIVVPDEPEAFQQATMFASQVIPQVQRCFGQ